MYVQKISARIQTFYLSYFESCHSVLDLACGDADFVALLHERGIHVLGIDSDEKSYQAAIKQNLPVIQADVFEYLHQQPDASVDGIFSAHLVEHLPYPKVIELVEQSFRILRPGGRIVLATPNVRTLFSHLEMFYLHYGHVTFYHPRLLCFFLDHIGFVESQFGENPTTASPMMPKVSEILAQPKLHLQPELPSPCQLSYSPVIPLQGNSLLSHVSYRVKRWWTRMFVQPFTDELVLNTNRLLAQMAARSCDSAKENRQSNQRACRYVSITQWCI